MERFKNIVFTFASVTTGSVIGAAIFLEVFAPTADITKNILWQILIVSLICSLGNFLYPNKKLNRKQMNVISLIHYTYVNCIVLGGGIYFKWFEIEKISKLIFMWALVSIVFIVIVIIMYKKAKMESESINKKIEEYRNKAHTQ